MTISDSSDDHLQNGTLHIKDGQIFVTDPDPGGAYAVLCPCAEIDVYVDGNLIIGETQVNSKNKIELVSKDIPGEYSFDITVDKKKMHAFLGIDTVPGIKYKVKDSWPSKERVEMASWKSLVSIEIPEEEIYKAMKEKGIVYGIDKEAVARAVRDCPKEDVLIASGVEAQKGQDARIEACFQEDRFKPRNSEALWVDNFDYGNIASAEAGMVIARKIPAQPGKPGMDLTGKKLDPPPVRDVQLKAGAGVVLSTGDMEAIAKVSGRPQIKGSTVMVTPLYKVKGDVDKTTGNVNFAGDVVIEGNILDAMKVRAGGSVKVLGHVTHCQVEAGGDITIDRNVISSKVKAGGSRNYLFPIRDLLSPILDYFEKLTNILRGFFSDPRITGRPEVKKYGPGAVLKIILDTRFPSLAKDLQELDRLAAVLANGKKQHYDDGLASVAREMKQCLSGTGPLKFNSPEEIMSDLDNFTAFCRNSLEGINEILQEKATISLNYAQHSTLEATGDVVINGQGCYNTHIVCGGDVIGKDKLSFFRGGQIKAEGNVELYELGSPGGASTRIEVPSEKEINAVVTHQGVTIKHGARVKVVGEKAGDL